MNAGMARSGVRRLGQAPSPPPQDLAEVLRREGAIVSVQIAASSRGGIPGGTPQVVKGLVDTGASISTVSDAVAQAAGLQQVGSAPLGGVGGTSERPIYAASFSLPDYGVTIDPIEIAGVTIPLTGVDVLIGRDVLKALRLDWIGPAGQYSLKQEGLPGAPGRAPEAPETQTASGEPSPTLYWAALGGGMLLAALVGLSAFDVI
jgi:hypothetical protein